MNKKIIIGNWKMNPSTLEEAVKLADKVERGVAKLEVAELENVDVVVAAPFIYLYPIRSLLKRVKLGAQDVFWESSGAYTGEVSWSELKDMVVRYVIVGHSERRVLGETESRINKKLKVVEKQKVEIVDLVQWSKNG